jgi:hypothetical protein
VSAVVLVKNDDPIRGAIKAHARAFASRARPSQDWSEIHSSAEALLEVMPSSVEGVIALALHCVDLEMKYGPDIWPRTRETFACRALAHVASALIRLRWSSSEIEGHRHGRKGLSARTRG